jgi:hypothetical protein
VPLIWVRWLPSKAMVKIWSGPLGRPAALLMKTILSETGEALQYQSGKLLLVRRRRLLPSLFMM